MRTFLQCIREAWQISHTSQKLFYDALLKYGRSEQARHVALSKEFSNLAASVIVNEDLQSDFEQVILKTPGKKTEYDDFVNQGRFE